MSDILAAGEKQVWNSFSSRYMDCLIRICTIMSVTKLFQRQGMSRTTLPCTSLLDGLHCQLQLHMSKQKS